MHFNPSIPLPPYTIGRNQPVFIIAEAGVNHNGDMQLAHQLIDAAAASGAHAVKFQSFKTEELILKNVQKANYQQQTTDAGESQFDMLKRLEITLEQTAALQQYCRQKNILFLTTPFDEVSLDELDALNLPAYKISSTDLTNIPFIRRVASKGKPVFLSSGMSYLSEIEKALQAIHAYHKNAVLLQCTANYPVADDQVNLDILKTYAEKFDVLLGFSDHTTGIGASPYAVMFGACVIEKHFTLDKNMEGPDHAASLSPQELKQLVNEIKRASDFRGKAIKEPTEAEKETRLKLQKCLVAARDIQKGEILDETNMVGKRTGGEGISVIRFDEIAGSPASRNYVKNEIITP